jgi:hypothetical protein
MGTISDSDIFLAKAQRREVRKRVFFLKPWRLAVFARDIPKIRSFALSSYSVSMAFHRFTAGMPR